MTTKPKYQDDPRALAFACPTCRSKPDEPCTTPTETGQRKVRWLHVARTDLLAAS